MASSGVPDVGEETGGDPSQFPLGTSGWGRVARLGLDAVMRGWNQGGQGQGREGSLMDVPGGVS